MRFARAIGLFALCSIAAVGCGKEPVIVEAGLGAACTRNADCASPFLCIDAKCVPTPLGCQPGEQRCNGSSVERCDEAGLSFTLLEQCAAGCEAGACVAQVCTPGSKRCEGEALTACLPNGSGYAFVQFCANDCADGACKPPPQACAPNAKRCNGLAQEACLPDGLGWAFVQFCPFQCTEGACVEPAPACTPRASRCNGRAVEACTPEGTGWAFVQYCATDCVEGACAPAACRPFATRCGSPASLETCSADGLAWVPSACGDGQACERGACVPTVCTPDVARCSGARAERCNSLGTGWSPTADCAHGCLNGACLDATCVPGSRQCNDRAVEQCLPDGTGHVFLQYCATSCLDGACTAAVCRPTEVRCADATTLQTCNGEGTGWLDASCGPNAACDRAQCRPSVCTPSAARCSGRVRETCSPLGTEWSVAETCQYACADGVCAPAACEAGIRRCAGTAVEACKPDQTGFAFVEFCTDTCVDGACTLPVCVPLGRRCSGLAVQVCSGSGSGWVTVDQCDDACTDGYCVASLQECAPGDRRCNGNDVQVCGTDGRTWTSNETCTLQCVGGACQGGGCRAFTLASLPTSLPADGVSTALVSSGLVTDNAGLPVADGTVFTVAITGGTFASSDADPIALGFQVKSLDGRIRFTARAPAAPGSMVITASLRDSRVCTGTVTAQATAPAGRMVFSEDFSGTTRRDPVATTANWDASRQRVSAASFDPSLGVNTGTGRDGDLVVAAGQTFNLQTSTRPGLTVPDVAVHRVTFIDTRYGNDFVFVDPAASATLAPGDEVMLVNAQGGACGAGNTCDPAVPAWASYVGVYEFLTVRLARPDGLVFFTTQVRNTYSDGGNADLGGQKVFIQRVPNYDRVTVDGTLTTAAWDPANRQTGMIVFRSRRGVTINAPSGKIDASGLGYRGGRADKGATGLLTKRVVNSDQTASVINAATQQQAGESYVGASGAYNSTWAGGGQGAGPFNCWWSSSGDRYLTGGGGGYATPGHKNSVGSDDSAPWGDVGRGAVYGDAQLSRLYLGSGGGGPATASSGCAWNNGAGGSCWDRTNGTQCGVDSFCRQYMCCNCGNYCVVSTCSGNMVVGANGGRGGGLIALWTHSLTVAGLGIVSNGTKPTANDNGGSGGSILIHANSATLGTNLVSALGAYSATYVLPANTRPPGDGRIAINYFDFALTGTTNPPAYTNLLGVFRKNMAQSFSVDSIDAPRVISAIRLVATNLKSAGGDTTFYVSADGGRTWAAAAAVGTDVAIPLAARGADLRWRAEFRPLNTDLLAVEGLVLEFATQ